MRVQLTCPVRSDRPGSAKNVACGDSVLSHVCSGNCLVYLPQPCPVWDAAKSKDCRKFSEVLGLEMISGLWTSQSVSWGCELK